MMFNILTEAEIWKVSAVAADKWMELDDPEEDPEDENFAARLERSLALAVRNAIASAAVRKIDIDILKPMESNTDKVVCALRQAIRQYYD